MSGATDGAGARWERTAIDYAVSTRGLPWDRAPLRGNRDLLDTQGCLPDGWLVGYKAIHRGVRMDGKLNTAMEQCDRALLNLRRPAARDGRGHLAVDCGGIIPVQVMQRSGYPAGKAYVVTEYDYFLDLAVMRRDWSMT